MQRRVYPAPCGHVYLFATCLVDLFLPEAGLDAVHLLEREGQRVHFPRAQSCCGQPAYTSGNPVQARAVARAQLDLFRQPWPVVVPSGSCAGMMRLHWPRLFDGEAARVAQAEELATRVFELSEFLVEVLKVDFRDCAGPPIDIGLHTSCSARREMGTRAHALELLGALPGVRVSTHENEVECCGFGGTFSLRHDDISGAMVQDKVASLQANASHFVTADGGCLLNIGHAAKKRGCALQGEHIASFVRRRVERKA
ncbi:(Fe-S)-binding protein [Methyloversatilis thermotolerans]|uniref:(Fe-S)-binding protein n=1 Tax=Methyloversatilis thermotolerans TaxID=1346290 RepID=UPI0003A23468|nr:(Fe-S)-binding protein [Methyloversatilis thermotolerans]